MDERAEALLDFWFAGCNRDPDLIAQRVPTWFRSDPAFDDELKSRFGHLVDGAAAGELDVWNSEPETALALVLLLDQFPRNLHRNSAAAFSTDSIALSVADRAVARHFDQRVAPIEAVFLYLPFEHAESITAQKRSVVLFEHLIERAGEQHRAAFAGFAEYARSHDKIVRRFGRFPHRNAALGRESTPEEAAWLAAGGETFS